MTVNIVSLKILLEMVFVMMKLIFTVAILMMAIVVETLLILAIVYNANAGVCLEFALRTEFVSCFSCIVIVIVTVIVISAMFIF